MMLFYVCTTFNILRMIKMECALIKLVDATKLDELISRLQDRSAF